jgi:hypothetical protein
MDNSEVQLDKLLDALENENNENIFNLTSRKMKDMNLKILRELQMSDTDTMNYLKKLKDYRYIDELNDLKYGSYVKWIPINDPYNIPLHHCGIICDIKITDNGIMICCKNFMHRHYTFKMDECLIFQKLSSQEKIIVSALDHLEESNDIDELYNGNR